MSGSVREPKAGHEVRASTARTHAVIPRALVLLCGGVRSNTFRDSIGCSIVDLPVDGEGRTLLDHWGREADELAGAVGRTMDVRLVTDQESVIPAGLNIEGRLRLSIERDPTDFRGTGGVLRDISVGYGDEEYILVGNGGQLMVEPLVEQFDAMVAAEADVCMVAHSDGTPCGLMLVRCGVLRSIPAMGFIDMKEQALTQIAQRHIVRVVQRETPVGLPVRTLSDYVFALRYHHGRLAQRASVPGAFDENLNSTFSIVHPTANVDPSAVVHDSVVLAGARVMPGAMLVRCVVGVNAVVPRDRRMVDHVQPAVRGRERTQA